MPAHRKLAAAAVVLAIGLGAALLFPSNQVSQQVAETAVPAAGSLATVSRPQVSGEQSALRPETEDVTPQGNVTALPIRPTLAPPSSDPPRATLTTVTAVEPDPRPALADPPELPTDYPREDPNTLRPVYPSVFDSGSDEEFEPGPYDERIHTVRDGDTLESLAQRYLGSTVRAVEIYDLNRALLARKELLPIGVDLRIPPFEVPPNAEHTYVDSPIEPSPPVETRPRRGPLTGRPENADGQRARDEEGLVPVRPPGQDAF